MGSGDWFKTIISLKKSSKEDQSKAQVKGPLPTEKSNGFKWRHRSRKGSSKFSNATFIRNHGLLGMPIEDCAAIRIQTTFRGFRARKALRHLKGIVRLQALTQRPAVRKQAMTTLNHIHLWSKIQAQVRARRILMVTEGRIRQKKHDNQLKLEAKLHELEVEWCGGSDTMEEILARIQQREEAAVRRERAMAYAFSHQWRANSRLNQGQVGYEVGKANWGWSWMERWIAARPWESRLSTQPTNSKRAQNKETNSSGKRTSPPTMKISIHVNPNSSNRKGSTLVTNTEKAKRLSPPKAEKSLNKVANGEAASMSQSAKTMEANTKQEQLVS